MTYLLDTMIVSYFLQAQRETELSMASKRCSMALVDEVRRELENDKKRGGKPFKRWFDASDIKPLAIELGTPAHAPVSSAARGVDSRQCVRNDGDVHEQAGGFLDAALEQAPRSSPIARQGS